MGLVSILTVLLALSSTSPAAEYSDFLNEDLRIEQESEAFTREYEFEPSAVLDASSAEPDLRTILRRKIRKRVGGQTVYTTPKVQYGVLFSGPSDYKEGEDLSLPPASTNKIFTAALALKELGGDYTYETRFTWNRRADEAADLTFIGAGDPSMEATSLPLVFDGYVAGLKAAGVKKVYGPLRFGSTDPRWAERTVPEGWLPRDLKTETGYIPDALGILTEAKIGTALKTKLAEFGITWILESPSFPESEGIQESVAHRSAPLREILKPFVQNSINYKGEAILRKIGELKGARSAPNLHIAGLTVLREFVVGTLSTPSETEGLVLNDGSGLSRKSLVTARALVHFLSLIKNEPYFPDFVEALATAAESGTLKTRMVGTPAAGRVRAKTGTLDGNYPLTGYLTEKTPAGTEYHPFAILTETKEAGAAYCRLVEDDALAQLAAWMLANGR